MYIIDRYSSAMGGIAAKDFERTSASQHAISVSKGALPALDWGGSGGPALMIVWLNGGVMELHRHEIRRGRKLTCHDWCRLARPVRLTVLSLPLVGFDNTISAGHGAAPQS